MKDIAERTLKVLDTFGWGQRKTWDPETGHVCLAGAVAATGDVGTAHAAFQSEQQLFWELMTGVIHTEGFEKSLVHWNDVDGRTEDEVRDLVRRAGEL